MILDPNTEERIREIETYVSFLQHLDTSGVELRTPSGDQASVPVTMELLKTLKATTYLLMYNLVESSIRSAVQSIFDDLRLKGISYDSVREELKQVCLRNIRRDTLSKKAKLSLGKSNSIALDIVTEPFDADDLFSGNVDAKKIRHIAEEFGFSIECRREEGRGGSDLRRVKEIRNDLGHGFRTFGDIGKDVSISEIVDIQKRVVAYIRDILENVRGYISGQRYLGRSAGGAT